jgi:ubiquinone/menaquinone biosynthesis C-methylase UbiE
VQIDGSTAENFSRYMQRYTHLYGELAQIIHSNMPVLRNRPLIIDVGVGPGYLPLEIHKSIPNAFVIGLDTSIHMLKIATKKNDYSTLQRFNAILANVEALPFQNNSADMIVSRFSLPYWKHPKKCFLELSRILKPGGRIVLETLNGEFPQWKLWYIKLHMFLKGADQQVIRYHTDAYKTAYTIDQIKHFLYDANLKLRDIIGDRKEWKITIVAEK